MAHSEARAWWADVQHLRNDYERTDEARRRADEADLASRRATRERRHVEAEMRRVSGPLRADGSAPRNAPEPALAPRRGRHGAAANLHPSTSSDGAPRSRAGDAGQRNRSADARLFVDDAPRRRPAEPIAEHARAARVKGAGKPGRPTIELHGRTVPAPPVPRVVDLERRRPARRPIERVGARPDRMAMWALLMGLLLILVALGTADTPAVIALSPF